MHLCGGIIKIIEWPKWNICSSFLYI